MHYLILSLLVLLPCQLHAEANGDAVYNNAEDFTDYINKTALEYNDPVRTSFVRKQEKE